MPAILKKTFGQFRYISKVLRKYMQKTGFQFYVLKIRFLSILGDSFRERLRKAEVDKYNGYYFGERFDKAGGFTAQGIKYVDYMTSQLNFTTVLDAGCGYGHALKEFNRRGFKCDGAEASKWLLENDLKELREKGIVFEATVNRLPFDDNSYDLVFCTDVLEHVIEFDINDAIKELSRVAKRYVFITVALRPSYRVGNPQKEQWYHVTVKPFKWWQEKFAAYATRVDSLEIEALTKDEAAFLLDVRSERCVAVKDKVTIIVVTYNNLECLARVTRDILEKTTYPCELIIVDNHSTDPKVREYLYELERQDNVRVIRLDRNIYYFPAVNAGIRKADPEHRYTLILNDDVIIESDNWIQEMIKVLESNEDIAYVGDFMHRPNCPPFGGWIDGWCMLFKTKVLREVGLFDEKYVWWYAPADYAVRTYKRGYRIKDIKQPVDRHNRVSGIITHIGGRTFDKVKNDPSLPLDAMFCPDFHFENLLLKHGFYRYYLIAKAQRLNNAAFLLLKKLVYSSSVKRIAPPWLRRVSKSLRVKANKILRRWGSWNA